MKKNKNRLLSAITAAVFVLAFALPSLAVPFRVSERTVPAYYNEHDYAKCIAFLETADENGIKNGEKLSDNYDPNDPETWGVHDEAEGDVFFEDIPNFTWAESNGELGLVTFNLVPWGCGLVGVMDVSDCILLTKLVCSGNNITEIDVTGCSSLNYLNCASCEITELDVSENSLLAYLNCSDTLISRIDVSFNTNLRFLVCMRNELASLDVRSNPELRSLYCSDTGIEELDLTNNPHLEELICEHNPVKEFDFTNNPQIWINNLSADGNGTVGYRTETVLPFDRWHNVIAYPNPEADFLGWYDADGELISTETVYELQWGGAREFIARFSDTAEPIVPGDVDGSGTVTVSDAILALRSAMEIYELTEEQFSCADVNGNGSVDVSDAIMILRFAMGII